MGRFDYVKYDAEALELSTNFKFTMTTLEDKIDILLKSPRAKALALTKLEECYMWVGKAIRDDQVERNKETELQEERSNS
jgi:hypothetical protein